VAIPELCWKEIEGTLDLDGIDAKARAVRYANHEAKMLVITIRQMLVDGHEPVGRVQRQDRAARREQKDAVNEMATLDTDHGSGPGTGRRDGRNVGFLRFENAKTPPVAQVFSNFHFIVQESSLPSAATYNEYPRMGAALYVR